MPQHSKITLSKVEDFIEYLEYADHHGLRETGADLFRLLPVIDAFLVRHGRTDLARSLRRAFDKLNAGL